MTNDILSAGPFPFFSSLSLSVSCGCKRDGGMPQICHICLLTAGHSDEHFKLPQERAGCGDAKAGGKLASHCFSGGSSGGDFSKLSTADNAQRDAVHVANCQPKTMPIAAVGGGVGGSCSGKQQYFEYIDARIAHQIQLALSAGTTR